MPDLITVDEVAALLRTTPTAIYGARYRGEAPASYAVRIGRRLLWRRGDVEAWIDSEAEAVRAAAEAGEPAAGAPLTTARHGQAEATRAAS